MTPDILRIAVARTYDAVAASDNLKYDIASTEYDVRQWEAEIAQIDAEIPALVRRRLCCERDISTAKLELMDLRARLAELQRSIKEAR